MQNDSTQVSTRQGEMQNSKPRGQSSTRRPPGVTERAFYTPISAWPSPYASENGSEVRGPTVAFPKVTLGPLAAPY